MSSSPSKEDPSLATREFYNTHAEDYVENINRRGLTHIPQSHLSTFLEYISKNSGGKSILEVGSGPGRDAKHFDSKGYFVTATDFSSSMVQMSNSLNLSNATFHEMDMRKLRDHFAPSQFHGMRAFPF